ncbi:hypothetical protein VKT23_008325 [Stygiomarasmius scandens]|uniref:Uncharacterized protein n=1 Tax=Marasmiellus scandens TaxID=2682957 RepID=A0ABR1JKN1_9AGAR
MASSSSIPQNLVENTGFDAIYQRFYTPHYRDTQSPLDENVMAEAMLEQLRQEEEASEVAKPKSISSLSESLKWCSIEYWTSVYNNRSLHQPPKPPRPMTQEEFDALCNSEDNQRLAASVTFGSDQESYEPIIPDIFAVDDFGMPRFVAESFIEDKEGEGLGHAHMFHEGRWLRLPTPEPNSTTASEDVDPQAPTQQKSPSLAQFPLPLSRSSSLSFSPLDTPSRSFQASLRRSSVCSCSSLPSPKFGRPASAKAKSKNSQKKSSKSARTGTSKHKPTSSSSRPGKKIASAKAASTNPKKKADVLTTVKNESKVQSGSAGHGSEGVGETAVSEDLYRTVGLGLRAKRKI